MKKWAKKSRQWVLVLFSLGVFSELCHAQPCKTSVKVIATKEELAAGIKANPSARFVRLQQLIPNLKSDIRYATSNNFTHTVLYHNPVLYMRSLPAEAVKKVQEELGKKGLGLKVYDAYRPFSVTCTMWQVTTDKHYVANPRRGSHHNRGIAVDLTIIDLATGKELEMGTEYDSFTEAAHHTYTKLPLEVLANRKLLKNLMWKHGFNYVPTEWWHYHWRDKSYDCVDLDFKDME